MNKRLFSCVIILGIILSLTACKQTAAKPIKGADSTVTDITTSETSSTEAAGQTTSSEDSSPESTETPSTSTSTESADTTTTAGNGNTGTTSKAPTPPASSTSSQSPAQSATSTSAPSTSSTPTESPAPAFDSQPYVDYAISYGKSIGLKYETAIGTGNWNSPLNLYASLTDESMKKGIRSSCDRLVREGFEYFWVSAVKQKDQSYQLFVYYG